MATQKQIEANRENSKKSTWPRTAEGKQVVSQNAVKHGLFADGTVVNGEDQGQFHLYRETLLAELSPEGAVETMLAERFVSLSWRLRRAERMQNQAIDEMIDDYRPTKMDRIVYNDRHGGELKTPEPNKMLGRVARKDYARSRVLDRLMLYERRIESSMFRTMRELERLQLLRRAEQAGNGETAPAANHRVSLKKQSQFAPALIGTKPFIQMIYDDTVYPDSVENKANKAGSERSRTGQFPMPSSNEAEHRKISCG